MHSKIKTINDWSATILDFLMVPGYGLIFAIIAFPMVIRPDSVSSDYEHDSFILEMFVLFMVSSIMILSSSLFISDWWLKREKKHPKKEFILTEEHHEGYCCKGICHKDMRCSDLPDAETICGSREETILTDKAIVFLLDEIKKLHEVEPEWTIEVKKILANGATVKDSRETSLCKSNNRTQPSAPKTRSLLCG